jgi:exosome complex component RRP41
MAMVLVSEEGFREDGRKPKELRRMEISSCYIEGTTRIDYRQGNTQVVAVSSGPREAGKLNINAVFYSVARQEPINEKRVGEYEAHLHEIFGNIVLSNSSVDIDIVVKEDGGSVLSAMINCITLCLCHLGVPMADMCVSTTLAGECVDLSGAEEGGRTPVVVLAYLMNSRKIAFFQSSGRITRDRLKECFDGCLGPCELIYDEMRNFLYSVAQN